MSDLVVGGDGRARCGWAGGADDYERYHDAEWARPVTDETGLFERMSLEGFQSGLSWITILRKREGFRSAFAGFDIPSVAGFTDADVERLVADPAIVRHRGKITAVITNARLIGEMHDRGETLGTLLWSFAPEVAPAPAALGDVPAVTDASTRMSKELRRRGFRFVGPTTAYALMQAVGMVNDHVNGCWVRDEVERAIAARPRPVAETHLPRGIIRGLD